MKKDLVELVFILDKSGSMSGLESDTIGGFNSLIQKQKDENGEALVTTIMFNNKVDVIHDRVNIQDVKKLTKKEYFVSGTTALLDAVGNTLNNIQNVQNKLPDDEKPEKTLFVITTDGKENASFEYSYKQIKQMITKAKEELQYEFIFLGANIDSEVEAHKLGIDRENAVNFNNDCQGISINYEALGDAIGTLRREKRINSKWRKSIDADKKNRK